MKFTKSDEFYQIKTALSAILEKNGHDLHAFEDALAERTQAGNDKAAAMLNISLSKQASATSYLELLGKLYTMGLHGAIIGGVGGGYMANKLNNRLVAEDEELDEPVKHRDFVHEAIRQLKEEQTHKASKV